MRILLIAIVAAVVVFLHRSVLVVSERLKRRLSGATFWVAMVAIVLGLCGALCLVFRLLWPVLHIRLTGGEVLLGNMIGMFVAIVLVGLRHRRGRAAGPRIPSPGGEG